MPVRSNASSRNGNDVRAGTQHRDVAQPRRSPTAVVRRRRSHPSCDGPGHGGRHFVGLGRSKFVGLCALRVLVAPENRHRRPDARSGADRLQGDVVEAGTAPALDRRRARSSGWRTCVLTHSMIGTDGPEVRRQLDDPAALGTETSRWRRGTSRCRPVGTGRSTASGRRPRTGGPASPRPPPTAPPADALAGSAAAMRTASSIWMGSVS